jgi:hypothetical protein
MLFAMARLPCALAQDQSSLAPRTIRGTVTNSVTGEPIYRAMVQLGGQYATLTDHDGHFELVGTTLPGIPPWAMKPGYFSQDRFNRSVTASVDNASQSDAEIVVKLIPEAVISGAVTGQDGNPLEGLPVQLKMLLTQDGFARWRPRMQTRTNAEGRYRFAELEAGKYIVSTGFHAEGASDTQAGFGYIPARYPPAGGDSSSANVLMLKPGDHAVADLAPEMEKLFPVTGLITGYGESRGVTFRAETPSGEEFSPTARFRAQTGEFRIMLPGGTYQVLATAYTRPAPLEARREITVSQGALSGVSFNMEPFASIPVDVEIDAVNPPSDGTASVGQSSPVENFAGNIGLTNARDGAFGGQMTAGMRRGGNGDPSGTVEIGGISPGRYILHAEPPSPWYVASASCGAVDLTHEELAVGGSSVGCAIHVVLRNDSGSAHVTIRDAGQNATAAPQRALYVYVVPLSNLAQSVVAHTQQNGDYSADGLAPGRYLILALDHRVELPYRDPDAMRAYSQLGQEISVTANGKADVEVARAAEAQ